MVYSISCLTLIDSCGFIGIHHLHYKCFFDLSLSAVKIGVMTPHHCPGSGYSLCAHSENYKGHSNNRQTIISSCSVAVNIVVMQALSYLLPDSN